jgi:hypothetical protein
MLARSLFPTLLLSLPLILSAAPITISGYNINDAVQSGHGNWAHTYNGTITSGAAFTHNAFPGTRAAYSNNGSGTLNDGVIGTNDSVSQLFVNGAASSGAVFSPVLFLILPGNFTLNQIEIFGGSISFNQVPGTIQSVDVTLIGPGGTSSTVNFNTTPFGPLNANGVNVNDRITITGSALDTFVATSIQLSNFNGTFLNWFSITEITLDGTPAAATGIPEPGTMLLTSLALGGVVFSRRRR